jgi:hypothetical protein
MAVGNGRRKGARKKTSSRKKAGRKKATTRKKTTGRKKSTRGRKKSTRGRKKSTRGRKKSTDGRKKSAGGRKKSSRRKYGKKAGRKVERAMHEMKRGELTSGRSGKKVKSRKQAIAIGLSEARQSGGKVPPNPNRRTRSSRKRS